MNAHIFTFFCSSLSLYMCVSRMKMMNERHTECVLNVYRKKERRQQNLYGSENEQHSKISKNVCISDIYVICDIVVVVSACVCVTTSALHGCFTLNYSDCTCIHRFFTTLLNPRNSNKTGTTLNIEHRNWTEESSKKDSQHRLCAYAVRFFKHSNQNDRQKIGMRCCTKDFFSTSNWVSVTREAFNAKAYCATKHTHKYTHQWLHAIIETERTLPFFCSLLRRTRTNIFPHISQQEQILKSNKRKKRIESKTKTHTNMLTYSTHTRPELKSHKKHFFHRFFNRVCDINSNKFFS